MHYERWRAHGDPTIKKKTGPKPLVQSGQVFGRLVVLEDTGERYQRDPIWLCRCKCGSEVRVRGSALRKTHTRSCGCLQRDIASRKTPIDEKVRAYVWRRRQMLKKKYGLTPEEAEAMLVLGCNLCGIHDDLCIDHDHMNGKARAALCRKCNSMLGLAEDSPERLRTAAEYLEKHSPN